jgi:hypothetical protein
VDADEDAEDALEAADVEAAFFVGLDVDAAALLFERVDRVEPVDEADATEFDRDLVDRLGGMISKVEKWRFGIFWGVEPKMKVFS